MAYVKPTKKVFQLRLSPKEKEMLLKQSKKMHRSMTDYIKWLLQREYLREREEEIKKKYETKTDTKIIS